MIKPTLGSYRLALASALLLGSAAWGQQAPTPPAPATGPDAVSTSASTTDEQIVHLTPFEVSAETETGYNAATTLAGNRLNTDLRDIGNAVSVVTKQFLNDVGATDNLTLLQYMTNTEVGSVYGNFAGTGDGATPDQTGQFINPNQNTRVRGLTAADNTRNYFQTDIPWDGYNIDRVDFQRGPNSILFGQGSPAGIINAGTQPAGFQNSGQLETRLGSYGSSRLVLNLNRVLIPKQLAVRLALLRNDVQYEQDPAYSADKRMYAAMRYEPALLNRNGIHTVLQANIEFGDIDSNNPRSLPPFDTITPWFLNGTYQGTNTAGKLVDYPYLNRSTYGPAQLQDNNTSTPNHGQMTPTENGGDLKGQPNPWYQPWIGNFGQQFASPLVFYSDASAAPVLFMDEPGTVTTHGIGPDGQVDKNVGGVPYQRPGGVADYATFAKNARLPFWDSGLYKDKSLTDPSVFNFYKQLLDGPNKKEWQNFRAYNLNLAQTYFDNQLGWEAQYNNEWWKGGQEGILSSWRQGIGIDLMSTFADGSPNPNVGRPYVTDSAQFSSNQTIDRHESGRLTLMGQHNFARDPLPKWLGDLLGEHTITGLLAEDRRVTDYRTWQRFGTDQAYKNFLNGNQDFNANERTPDPVIYLGPSLINRSTAAGANIPRPMAEITMPSTTTIRIFNSNWNKPTDPSAPGYVDPAQVWYNPYWPTTDANYTSTQSENPANYVGWVNQPINLLNSDTSQAVRDQLTTLARLTKNVVKSKAFVWQGKLWHNFLIVTGGVRRDTAEGWSYSTDTNSTKLADKHLNLSPFPVQVSPGVIQPGYSLSSNYQTRIDVTSRSWSLVAHLSDLVHNNFPLEFSVYYARSTNFQPFSNRVDVYGHPIGAPSGKTQERGILLETRDGKYSLKINRYETQSRNQNSSALGGAWFIGSSQAWAANWVNRFEYNWSGDTIANAVPNPDPNNSQYNYAPAPGETLADAQQREANVIAAWRAWQKSVNPDFYTAWHINLNDLTKPVSASVPAGFAVTEDSVSKGYEVEFNAQPTRNWRIQINASKTDAIRTNVGGAALTDFITKYEKALNTTPVGDLRIWWGGAGNETTKIEWNSNIGAEYHQRMLQEGTDVPEMRKWHANLVTNYDFDHGLLKGFGVGGGLRWESNVIIGYRPIQKSDGTVTFDMANPYRGPAETAVDLWASYRHRLTDKVDWKIQLNVYNVNYNGDALIPINTEPDGTPAAYRIRPPRTFQLTNTFSF